MFDLIQGKVDRPYRRSARSAIVCSAFGHTALGTIVVVSALVYGSGVVPKVRLRPPAMTAFVASPVPPPAPPVRRRPVQRLAPAQQVTPARQAAVLPSSNPNAAPVEAPDEIEPEALPPTEDVEGGVEGGVQGGIAGTVISGMEGIRGLLALAPPPSPAAPPSRQPVRVGGTFAAPALLHRVEPVYPPLAVAARVEGVVVLEAIVDGKGRVCDVKVLRSGQMLDGAAVEAVRQWRYAPLMLDGVPNPFVLTVTLSFALAKRGTGAGVDRGSGSF
jgi:protein TonB